MIKKTFDGDKPKKPLSAKDIEIDKDLFLPDGRVTVKATLVSYWSVGNIYESTCIEFETDEGDKFYYKGTGQLTELVFDNAPKICEFCAAFERGKLDDEYVSFVKRSTKVKIGEVKT